MTRHINSRKNILILRFSNCDQHFKGDILGLCFVKLRKFLTANVTMVPSGSGTMFRQIGQLSSEALKIQNSYIFPVMSFCVRSDLNVTSVTSIPCEFIYQNLQMFRRIFVTRCIILFGLCQKIWIRPMRQNRLQRNSQNSQTPLDSISISLTAFREFFRTFKFFSLLLSVELLTL